MDETISENVEERSDFNVEVKFEENEIKNEQLDEDGIGIGNAIGSSGDGDGDGDRDGDREVGGGGAFGDSGIGLERPEIKNESEVEERDDDEFVENLERELVEQQPSTKKEKKRWLQKLKFLRFLRRRQAARVAVIVILAALVAAMFIIPLASTITLTPVDQTKFPPNSLGIPPLNKGLFKADSYELTFQLSGDQDLFFAEMLIQFKLKEDLATIDFHQNGLRVVKAHLVGTQDKMEAIDITHDDENQIVKIHFPDEVDETNQGKIKILYYGNVSTDMTGFYRSLYSEDSTPQPTPEMNRENAEGVIFSTHFEPQSARKALVCIDEPSMKAHLSLSLQTPIVFPNILANTKQKSQEDCKSHDLVSSKLKSDIEKEVLGNAPNYDYSCTKFDQTPPISTYLIAFAIGKFEKIERTKTADGTSYKLACHTIPGFVNSAKLACDVADFVLDWYGDYFGVPIAFPGKMDLVAIPDFIIGAMENWGLATFKSEYLLYNPEVDSVRVREKVSFVVSHELAHQWTGDYVTIKWWNDAWLKEGFATFFEYESLSHLPSANLPDNWNCDEMMIVQCLNRALIADGVEATHALSAPYHIFSDDDDDDFDDVTAAEIPTITEMFDTVTYQKGASILRMIKYHIGEKLFEKGFKKYFEWFTDDRTRTTTTTRFLDLMGQGTEMSPPFRDVYSSWIETPGYPLVTVSTEKGKVHMNQKRFYTQPSYSLFSSGDSVSSASDASDFVWHIPLSFMSSGGKGGSLLLNRTDTQTDINVEGNSDDFWVMANRNRTGFFRVNYSPELWNSLQRSLSSPLLSDSDRAGLVNDILVLSRSFFLSPKEEADPKERNEEKEDPVKEEETIDEEDLKSFVSIDLALDFTGEALKDSESYVIWMSAFDELDQIVQRIDDHLFCLISYQEFLVQLVSKLYSKLGWESQEDESYDLSILRQTILSFSVKHNHTEAVQKALSLFRENDPNFDRIPSESRRAVYTAAILYGTEDDFWSLFKYYRSSSNDAEQSVVMSVMGETSRYHLLQFLLQSSLDKSLIRPQHRPSLIYGASKTSMGRQFTWNFIRENYDIFNVDGPTAQFVLRSVVRNFQTESKLNEVQQFFEKNPPVVGELVSRSATEAIQANIFWRTQNLAKLCDNFLNGPDAI